MPEIAKENLRVKRLFLTAVSLWTIIMFSAGYIFMKLEKDKVTEITLQQARSYFNMILLTRRWNANNGGVYVPVNNKNQPNPWLQVPNRDIVTVNGQNLTLINPAYMTRQLSEIVEDENQIRFHMTSLKPINPANVPSEWEREALASFTQDKLEQYDWWTVDSEMTFFKYMAPLWTEKACLKCHGEQGYEEGDLRGGITVSIPANKILEIRNKHAKVNFTVLSIIYLLVLAGIWQAYKRIINQFNERTELIAELQKALGEIKTLKGFIPICASCKKIRTDSGYWESVEEYITQHSEAVFSHGICPDCMKKLYPEIRDDTEEDDD